MTFDERNLDFVDFNKIVVESSGISIFSDEWPLEVISTELQITVRQYVDHPESYEGTYSRLLILMQWVNILGVLTSGAVEIITLMPRISKRYYGLRMENTNVCLLNV